MVEVKKSYAKVEHLIYVVSENQKFAKTKDRLTALIEKYSDYLTEELLEVDLEYAAAAKMPNVPKYKKIK